MKYKAAVLIIFSILFGSSIYPQAINRIEGSPYPSSAMPDTLYKVVDSYFSQSEMLTVETLQGILARVKPEIYRISSPAYEVWLKDLEDQYGIVVIDSFQYSFEKLINHFKDKITHYILCNLNDNSTNVAISLSGLTGAVAAAGASKSILEKYGITMLEDVRERDENWFFENYGEQVNKKIFCFQKESMFRYLADYSSFGRMITFYNPAFNDFTTKIFNSFDPNAVLFGWGFDEYELVNEASKHDIFIHAADYASNLSTLTNFNAETKQKKFDRDINTPDSAHYVCFLMSDGDNIQWTLGGFSEKDNWYGSPRRGEASIGWTMAPALSELAPTVLKRFYDDAKMTEKGKDYFVAGPSGGGYAFPENFSDMQKFVDFTSDIMKKSDLRIINMLSNKDNDVYLEPFLEKDNIDAIFYYFYSNYAGGNGKIKWVNNKPVIYGRYRLWKPDYETPESLADKLNKASKNIHSADGYSLIPVHVWSISTEEVLDCISRLDSNVIVVSPDEFVNIIKRNLGPKEKMLNFVPDNNETEQNYLLPGYQGTGYDSSGRHADFKDVIGYHFNKSAIQALNISLEDLFLVFSLSNEYVASITPNIDSARTEIARWRTTNVHIHGDWNKKDVEINLSELFSQGWEDIYVFLEDGLKDDAFGAKVHEVSLARPGGVTGIEELRSHPPADFSLEQNYPNPFNPSTKIEFNIAEPGMVKLKIIDILGRHIKTIVENYKQSGSYTVEWDGTNSKGEKVSSGVYLSCLIYEGQIEARKMLLSK